MTGNNKKTQDTVLSNVLQWFNAKLFKCFDFVHVKKKKNCKQEKNPGILSCLKSGKLDLYLFMPCFAVQVMWTWWTGCSWMLASPRSWSRSGKIINCSKWSTTRVKLPCFKKWTQMVQVFLRRRYLSCNRKSTFHFVFFPASSLHLLCLSGPLSWPDLLPPTEGSQGSTPKGTCRAGLRERGMLDLEAWEGADSRFGIIA